MKSEFCIIDIECCICLEIFEQDIYNLKCCSNQIHNKCVYEMFLHEPIKENKVIFKCPFCRTQENFNCILSVKDIKKYTNEFEILNKYKLCKDNKCTDICKLFLTKFIMILFFIILIYIFLKCV